jgi:alkaline phosphatase
MFHVATVTMARGLGERQAGGKLHAFVASQGNIGPVPLPPEESPAVSSIRTLRLATCAAVLALTACTAAFAGDTPTPAPASATAAAPRAKNVILFIGDGMGISTITAARIYAGQKLGHTGEEYVLPFEKFPNVALVKTYNTDAQVPDSAGTATAINSGVKTRMGLIGVSTEQPRGVCKGSTDNRLVQIAGEAHDSGREVGIVTTARITHATPAAVYANAAERDWESDSDMSAAARAEGCSDIATQLMAYPFDVALGGGTAKFYGADKGGKRLDAAADLPAAWAAKTGGSYVQSEAALAAAPTDRPVLGIFTPSHMSYMVDRKPDSTEPTLTQMTAAAISHLSTDPKGYYLMVEGGRIDHAHHEGRAGYALEETVEFANAIQYAIDHTDPANTLILVTADHSHVFFMAGYPRRGNPILGLVVPPAGDDDADHGGGGEAGTPALAEDGKPYTTLSYGNGPGAVAGERPMPETGVMAHQQSLIPMESETHGGEDVALFATGPGSERAHGVIEQNVIYWIMRQAMGLGDAED